MVLKLTTRQLHELAEIQERNNRISVSKDLDEIFRLCLIGMGSEYHANDVELFYKTLIDTKAVLDMILPQAITEQLETGEPADLS